MAEYGTLALAGYGVDVAYVVITEASFYRVVVFCVTTQPKTASSGSNPVLRRLTSNIKHFYGEKLVLRRALSARTSRSSRCSPERMWFSALLTVF